MMAANGDLLTAVTARPEDVLGINSPDQLAEASRELQRRVNQDHMESGVTIIDPATTYIDDTVTLAPGSRIYPNTHLEGSTTVGAGANGWARCLCHRLRYRRPESSVVLGSQRCCDRRRV